MRDRGVLLALGGLLVGILAGEHAEPAPAVGALAIGVAALVAAWFVDGPTRLAVAAVALALIGAAQTERALDGQAHFALAGSLAHHAHVTLPGVLADDP